MHEKLIAAKSNGHSKSKIEFSQIHKMFRHEACSSSDVIAAVKAAQSQSKLSESKKAVKIAEKEAAQKAIKETPKN